MHGRERQNVVAVLVSYAVEHEGYALGGGEVEGRNKGKEGSK